jgi:hypothetical protein
MFFYRGIVAIGYDFHHLSAEVASVFLSLFQTVCPEIEYIK